MELTGGCLCGEIRYRSTGTPVRRFVCHCKDCQKSSGSAFHVGVTVPRDGFAIVKGAPRAYRSVSDAGRNVARWFCPNCGSGLYNEIELRPGFVALKAGSLDNPDLVPPTYELFTKSKMSCAEVAGARESFPGMTPAGHQPVAP